MFFLPQDSPVRGKYESAARRVEQKLETSADANTNRPKNHLAMPLIPYGVLSSPKKQHAQTLPTKPPHKLPNRPKPKLRQPKSKPRTRFPHKFPSNLADGVSQAQVLTLGEDGKHKLPPTHSVQQSASTATITATNGSRSLPRRVAQRKPLHDSLHSGRNTPIGIPMKSTTGLQPKSEIPAKGLQSRNKLPVPSILPSALPSNSNFVSGRTSEIDGQVRATDGQMKAPEPERVRTAIAELERLRAAAAEDLQFADQYKEDHVHRSDSTSASDGARDKRSGTRDAQSGTLQPSRSGSNTNTPGLHQTKLLSQGAPVENEEELRLRLASAESVMRKLYRRNNELEQTVSQLATDTDAAHASDDKLGKPPIDPTLKSIQQVGPSTDLEGADAHALFMLQQKEKDLMEMREYSAALQKQLDSAAVLSGEQETISANGRITAEANEYKKQLARARSDYRKLLRSRVGVVKGGNKVSEAVARTGDQEALLEHLDKALLEEANLHRLESQRLNEKLYLQEKQSCDWYVERRVLEGKLVSLGPSSIGQSVRNESVIV